MANIRSNLVSVGEILGLKNPEFSFINPPLIAAPNTTILNEQGTARKLPDPSKTARANMGIERIQTQQIIQLQNEYGPNGEPVWAAVNDDSNRIRFVGSGWSGNNTTLGPSITTATIGDYLEVTFYGVGLNLLSLHDANNSSRGYVYSVDGGADSANVLTQYNSASGVIVGRNYSPNQITPIVTGLTLGVHTVKIKGTSSFGSNIWCYGFEILGNTSSISIPSGELYASGKKFTNPTAQTLAYNSGFDGSPSLNGRGGRVVAYLSENGILGKVIQQVNGAQANLTSADHANEEVIRTYSHREFGAGRADDFSSLVASSSNRAFTLDDGITTLVGSNILLSSEGLLGNITGDFFTLTFVGTGLDILSFDGGSIDPVSVTINGTNVGNLTSLSTSKRVRKIISGLPYGTHTVKFTRTSAASGFLGVMQFIVYGPKKPSIPSGSIELCDYNLMADYNESGLTTDYFKGPVGAIFKGTTREHIYRGSGTWSVDTPAATYSGPGGNSVFNTATSAIFEYTFFGTGVALEFSSNTGGTKIYTIAINGVNNASGTVFGGATNAGAGSYTIPTGTSLARWVSFQGLTLGKNTVTVTCTDATALSIIYDGLWVTTPIHSPKSNLYADLQNTLPVGSNALSFSSKHGSASPTATKAWAQAVGITSSPTTTSTSLVPMPDMSTVIKITSNSMKISYSAQLENNTANQWIGCQVYVDGVAVGPFRLAVTAIINQDVNLSDSFKISISPGTHKVDLYWRVSATTGLAYQQSRSLLVEET